MVEFHQKVKNSTGVGEIYDIPMDRRIAGQVRPGGDMCSPARLYLLPTSAEWSMGLWYFHSVLRWRQVRLPPSLPRSTQESWQPQCSHHRNAGYRRLLPLEVLAQPKPEHSIYIHIMIPRSYYTRWLKACWLPTWSPVPLPAVGGMMYRQLRGFCWSVNIVAAVLTPGCKLSPLSLTETRAGGAVGGWAAFRQYWESSLSSRPSSAARWQELGWRWLNNTQLCYSACRPGKLYRDCNKVFLCKP